MISINITFGESQILKRFDILELFMGAKAEELKQVLADVIAATTEQTSIVQGAVNQIETLIDKIDELLAAAADAPTLEETNELIAEGREGLAAIKANSLELVNAVSAGTVAEGVA